MSARLSVWFSAVRTERNESRFSSEDVYSTGIDGAQTLLAAQNVEGRAVLCARFGQRERAGGKVERGQVAAASECGAARSPM